MSDSEAIMFSKDHDESRCCYNVLLSTKQLNNDIVLKPETV